MTVESKKRAATWVQPETNVGGRPTSTTIDSKTKTQDQNKTIVPISQSYPVLNPGYSSQGYRDHVQGSPLTEEGYRIAGEFSIRNQRKRMQGALKSQGNNLKREDGITGCDYLKAKSDLTCKASACDSDTSMKENSQDMVCDCESDEVPRRGLSKRDAPKDKSVRQMMSKLNLSDEDEENMDMYEEEVPQKRAYHLEGRCFSSDEHMCMVLSRRWTHLTEEEVEELYQQDSDGDNLLMVAILQGYVTLAHLLISLVPDPRLINLKNKLFQTALHMAVLNSNGKLVRDLVIHCADITAQDRNGNTALHLACKKNDLSSIIALTTVITSSDRDKCSYSVTTEVPQPHNIYNYRGQTCLHIAAEANYQKLVQFLVESEFSADVNAPDGLSGRTVLHLAAESGNKFLVKYLLKRKELNLHQVTYAGDSALDLALGRQHKKIGYLLFQAGAQQSHETTDSDVSEGDDDSRLEVDDFEVQSSDLNSMEKSLHSLAEELEYDDICLSGRSISDRINRLR